MIEAIFGLVGVLVGSAITVAREVWVGWTERRRTGSYTAIRLSSILDEYVLACVDVVQDDGTAYGQPAGRTEDGQEFLKPQVRAPEPPRYPDDIDWRSIDESLMHRVLSLPNAARSVDRTISVAAEFASPPDYDVIFSARHRGYVYLGIESYEIASLLRREFGITTHRPPLQNNDWDSIEYLRDRQQEMGDAEK